MNMPYVLFENNSWHEFKEKRLEDIRADINGLAEDRILHANVETQCQYFEHEYAFEMPVLKRDEINWISHEGTGISAIKLEVFVPFNGPSGVFGIRPETSNMYDLQILVSADHLTFFIDDTDLDADRVKSTIERTLDYLDRDLDNLREHFAKLQPVISRVIREQIEQRRENILAKEKFLSELGDKLT